MTPFGCEGGVQKTIAVVFDVPATPKFSTNPGAMGRSKHMHACIY